MNSFSLLNELTQNTNRVHDVRASDGDIDNMHFNLLILCILYTSS